MTLLTILIAVLAALQALDWITTRRALRAGGRELNPLNRWLFAAIGSVDGGLAVKTAIVLALAAGLLWMPSRPWGSLNACQIAAGVLVAWYGFWVWRNHATRPGR